MYLFKQNATRKGKGRWIMGASVPPYTGNKLKDEILFLLVCGVRIDRQMFNVIHPSASYISQTIGDLEQSGYILVHKETRPFYVVLARKGIELIREKDLRSYEHYMKISNQNRYGWTEKHLEVTRRAAGILTQMHAAGVCIGPQKPRLAEIMKDPGKKLDVGVPTFYLNKEIRYEDDQKQSRAQITRSSGILFSAGIRALVYNSMDAAMRIQRRAEMEGNIRLIGYTRDIYRDPVVTKTRDSIVFCKDDEAALRIFNHRTDRSGEQKLIGDVVWDRSLTGTEFRYIPLTQDGLISLRCITKMTRDDFIRFCFSEKEVQAARQIGMGDGIIGDRICYEFLSCNVSKLAWIKRNHTDLSRVGIVCWEGQAAFVRGFFDEENIGLRIVRRDVIEKKILDAEA